MKVLLVITGRGLGGDAVIALNVIKALEERGVECEMALDKTAPGILFKKNNYDWHKISIPQAGGHAASKKTAFKAAFRSLSAVFKLRSLIKKVNPDLVVGINGGGAVVGAIGAKLARTPSFSLICTPLDSKVCPRLNNCLAFPELFNIYEFPENVSKTYFPINPNTNKGDKAKALEQLKQEKNFDENKKTILFSSGSSIFEGVMRGVDNFSKATDEYNIVLVGLPLKEEYMDIIDQDKVIYLGYIDWLKDLYDYVDLVIATDDGLMIEESLACQCPTVSLTKVKWGRYHNFASIFEGAVIEAEVDNLNEKIFEALDNLDELKNNAKKYSEEILDANSLIANTIINELD